jgi:hypothetical protein
LSLGSEPRTSTRSCETVSCGLIILDECELPYFSIGRSRAEKFFHLYQAGERACLVLLQQNTIG